MRSLRSTPHRLRRRYIARIYNQASQRAGSENISGFHSFMAQKAEQQITGADSLVRSLESLGVRVVFANPGRVPTTLSANMTV